MSSNIFFISDAHLHCFAKDNDEKIKKEYLFEFLKEVQKKKGLLFIVGDLFDFWFEYKHVIPNRYFSVLSNLKETVNAGWSQGAWSVVLQRNLAGSGEAANLAPGVQTKIGFAVWDGGNQERAGIKAVSADWTEFELEA